MTGDKLVDYAEKYIVLGFKVIPLNHPVRTKDGFVCSCGSVRCQSPAKHPVGSLVPNGTKNASADRNVIEGWFGTSPWNIGIVTGATSNLVVLDIDPRHGGDESFATLEKTHGQIPQTVRFQTGGGGEHILFRHPGSAVKNSESKIGQGIDVRGDGGLVVAPPSQHISGHYYSISVDCHPDDTGIANLPPWLAKMITLPDVEIVGQSKWRQRARSAVPEGQRNDFLARVSGHLLAHGIDRHVCLDLVLSWNQTHCLPPLSDREVVAVVASITRRELAKRRNPDSRKEIVK